MGDGGGVCRVQWGMVVVYAGYSGVWLSTWSRFGVCIWGALGDGGGGVYKVQWGVGVCVQGTVCIGTG